MSKPLYKVWGCSVLRATWIIQLTSKFKFLKSHQLVMCTSNLTLFKRIPHILSCTFLLSALLLYSYFSVHVLIVLYTFFPKLTRHVKHLPIFHPLLSNRLCLSHLRVLFSIIINNRKRRIKKLNIGPIILL